MKVAVSLSAVLLTSSPVLDRVAEGQTPPQWTVTRDLRIGDISREDYVLTWIADVEVGPDGTIYVAQSLDKTIRVFGSDGKYLRTVGRAGAGPGEFRRIDSLAYGPAGLLALDRQMGRLTLFTKEGQHRMQWGVASHPFGDGFTSTPPVGQLRDGSLVIIPSYDARKEGIQRLPVTLFDSTLTFRATIGWLAVSSESRFANAGTLRAVIPQPVNSQTLWAIARDGSGIFFVDRVIGAPGGSGEFHLVKVGKSADTLLSRRFRVSAVPIPPEAVKRELDRAIDHVAGSRPFPREQIATLYRNGWSPLPTVQAPVDRVIQSADGSIWVRRGAFGLDEATWWVLNDRADIVARVNMPGAFHVMRVSGEYIWGVERGEFDEPYVVRYRINRR